MEEWGCISNTVPHWHKWYIYLIKYTTNGSWCHQPTSVISSMNIKMCHAFVYWIMSISWLWNHHLVQLHSLVCNYNPLYSTHNKLCEYLIVRVRNLIPTRCYIYDDNNPLYIHSSPISFFVSSSGTCYILQLVSWYSRWQYYSYD